MPQTTPAHTALVRVLVDAGALSGSVEQNLAAVLPAIETLRMGEAMPQLAGDDPQSVSSYESAVREHLQLGEGSEANTAAAQELWTRVEQDTRKKVAEGARGRLLELTLEARRSTTEQVLERVAALQEYLKETAAYLDPDSVLFINTQQAVVMRAKGISRSKIREVLDAGGAREGLAEQAPVETEAAGTPRHNDLGSAPENLAGKLDQMDSAVGSLEADAIVHKMGLLQKLIDRPRRYSFLTEAIETVSGYLRALQRLEARVAAARVKPSEKTDLAARVEGLRDRLQREGVGTKDILLKMKPEDVLSLNLPPIDMRTRFQGVESPTVLHILSAVEFRVRRDPLGRGRARKKDLELESRWRKFERDLFHWYRTPIAVDFSKFTVADLAYLYASLFNLGRRASNGLMRFAIDLLAATKAGSDQGVMDAIATRYRKRFKYDNEISRATGIVLEEIVRRTEPGSGDHGTLTEELSRLRRDNAGYASDFLDIKSILDSFPGAESGPEESGPHGGN